MSCNAQQRHGSQFVGGRVDNSLKGRIVGFGNGPEPPPLPDDYEYVWDEVEHALGSLYESTITSFDQVFEAIGIPSLTVESKPQVNAKTQQPSDTASTDFKSETLGAYRVVANAVIVSSTVELGGPRVANLGRGDEVVVTKLARCNTRIRARISQPHGWISLVDAKTGQRWLDKPEEAAALTKDTSDKPNCSGELPSKDVEQTSQPPPVPVVEEMADLIDMAIPSLTSLEEMADQADAGYPTSSMLMPPPPKSACPLGALPPSESDFGNFATFESPQLLDVAQREAEFGNFATFDSPQMLPPSKISHHTPRGLALFDPVDSKSGACRANDCDSNNSFFPIQRGISIFDPLSDKSLDWDNAFGN